MVKTFISRLVKCRM